MERQHAQELAQRFMAGRHALMGFIYSMVRDFAAAEDIFQEVWLRLQEASKRGEVINDPGRYCFAVAKNLILHYWRQQRTRKIVLDSELLELVEQALEEKPEGWLARRHALMECLQELAPPARQLLRMKYEEGLSFAAMAQRLGRSIHGLKMALCRIRQALFECAQRKLLSEEPLL